MQENNSLSSDGKFITLHYTIMGHMPHGLQQWKDSVKWPRRPSNDAERALILEHLRPTLVPKPDESVVLRITFEPT